jgi:hypothetical protein
MKKQEFKMSCCRSFFIAIFSLGIGISSLHASEVSIVVTPQIIINVDEQNIKVDTHTRSVTLLLNAEDMCLLSGESNLSNFERMRQIVAEEWNVSNCTLICKGIQNGDLAIVTDPNNKGIPNEIFSQYDISSRIPDKNNIIIPIEPQPLTFTSSTDRATTFHGATLTLTSTASVSDPVYQKITREDKDYAKHVSIQSFVLVEEQVPHFFSDPSRPPNQLSIKELIGRKSYLLVQIKNQRESTIEGELHYKHPGEFFPTVLNIQLPPNMEEPYFHLIPLGNYPSLEECIWLTNSEYPNVSLNWEKLSVFCYEDAEDDE